jgi:acyl carrier protein
MIEPRTADRVEIVLGEVLRDLLAYEDEITSDLKPEQVPGWDSLAHLNILEEMEKRFGVRFSIQEMVEMKDLPAMKMVLARHGVES